MARCGILGPDARTLYTTPGGRSPGNTVHLFIYVGGAGAFLTPPSLGGGGGRKDNNIYASGGGASDLRASSSALSSR